MIGDYGSDADNAVRSVLIGFRLHPRHRQLARGVHRLGELHYFLVLPALPKRLHRRLMSDVVDAISEDDATGKCPP